MIAELVTRHEQLEAALRRLADAPRIAVDLESNGLFKYKATLCTLQIATGTDVFVVDPFQVSVAPLADLLGVRGPRKIVHDIAFDARILAESGIVLGNVLDTSLTARMLGRQSTGLAALLGELGIMVDKRLQQHDWTERPLRETELRYLAEDVLHLHALADALTNGIRDDVAEAIDEETRYRLVQAAESSKVVDPRPPYLRLKGIDRVPKDELPILKRLADVRESKARALDVPPYKVLGPDVLFAIAKARPKTFDDLGRIKGATGGHRARSLAGAILDAVAKGSAEDSIPEDERKLLERPRIDSAVLKARRHREGRLSAWRKQEAKRSEVDEQVVLPGHCLQDLVDLEDPSLDAIATVPGIGAFRVERFGAGILDALAGRHSPEPS